MRGFKVPENVSWSSVREALEAMSEEFGCKVSISMEAKPAAYNGKACLAVIVTAWGGVIAAGLAWERKYRLDWPCYGCRTVAGLYQRAIWEFSEDLRIRPPKPGKAVKGLYPPAG